MLQKWKAALRRFLYGRYGMDPLNGALLGLGLILALISSFSRQVAWGILAYLPLLLSVYRSWSRDLGARSRENRRFLGFFGRLKDREHRYLRCPNCRQTVRVPRGKGTLKIRCPKCGETFLKKT